MFTSTDKIFFLKFFINVEVKGKKYWQILYENDTIKNSLKQFSLVFIKSKLQCDNNNQGDLNKT